MQILETVNRAVWGVPALILVIGVGIYLTFKTGFAQVVFFPKALKELFQSFRKRKDSSGVSSYQALCTALAATVGTGNLAGVAGAIAIGGPGALFWMWICGLLAMGTKFAEVTLAVRYRRRTKCGEFIGGPMYMIQDAMGRRWKWLAIGYSVFGLIASFGVGNATQINTLIGGVNSVISLFGGRESVLGNLLMGVGVGILVSALLLGGAKKVGRAAERLVPIASIGYLLLCTVVLILRMDAIPGVLRDVVYGAFSPSAVTGGVLGSSLRALRVGASRGVFTNEAGLGTASMAHSSAQVRDPVGQGMMGIVEVFLDTIVICTMTGLVVLCSGVYIPYGEDLGIRLTSLAFSGVLGEWVCIPISAAICCFAIATVIGWGLYGARCCQYLFGDKAWCVFAYAQAIAVVFGAVLETGIVWTFAEIVNGFMLLPNLIVLVYLSPELADILKAYKKRSRLTNREHEKSVIT